MSPLAGSRRRPCERCTFRNKRRYCSHRCCGIPSDGTAWKYCRGSVVISHPGSITEKFTSWSDIVTIFSRSLRWLTNLRERVSNDGGVQLQIKSSIPDATTAIIAVKESASMRTTLRHFGRSKCEEVTYAPVIIREAYRESKGSYYMILEIDQPCRQYTSGWPVQFKQKGFSWTE
jgi:hypothetical protein